MPLYLVLLQSGASWLTAHSLAVELRTAVTPAKAQGFYKLSFFQAKLDIDCKATSAWHRTKA